MTKLILHIGPGKCGSTSIQRFFALQKKPCIEQVYYRRLDPTKIKEMNNSVPKKSSYDTFIGQLLEDIKKSETVILSHESLARKPITIEHI